MARLDPALRFLAARPGAPLRRFGRRSMFAKVAPERPTANIMLEIEEGLRDVPDEVRTLGFTPRTRAGTVFTGDIPRDAIRRLEDVPGLKRAEASRALRNELTFAVPEARGGTSDGMATGDGAIGEGVIVGLIDTGIDFRHPSFLRKDGSSRILAIWDQALTPQHDGEAHPRGFTYGVEYTKDRIDAALRGGADVRHADPAPFHGTHVASIAAGTGEPVSISGGVERRFRGIAPGADLVIVANTRSRADDPGTVGDSADTLDAIAYVLRWAARPRRPVVINLSLGDNIGPHDGTSLLEVGIANLIEGRGRVLVKSAGNEADTRHHADGTLVEGVRQEVRVEVPDGEEEVVVDFWFSGRVPPGLQIVAPSGAVSPLSIAPAERDVELGTGTSVFVDAEASDPGNGHPRTFVVLRSKEGAFVEKGTWVFRLTGTGHWHAWIQRNSDAGFPQSTSAMTASVPAASEAVICVGSYISDDRYTWGESGELSDFSGRGPTRDGRRLPTLVAPGEEVTSAQSDRRFAAASGTSMAAAVVTGAVARLLQLKPSSTAAQIRDCLVRTARRDELTGASPNDEWGAGKLDIEAACRDIARSARRRNGGPPGAPGRGGG
jgi:subtilisin family serine protease